MSRLKRFAHSLASGYALLGANIIFTLSQWPLAIHYLSAKEFGLWTAVASLSTQLQLLVDLGMSGAISRILVDHKDDQTSDAYGTTIKTGTAAMVIQGAMIAGFGSVITLGLPSWMNIPVEFHPVFRNLMVGQCLVLGVAFAGRICTFILQAHNRYDTTNYAQIGGFAVNLFALWIGFQCRLGLYSLLVATTANLLFNNLYCVVAAARLKLFPAAGRWGRADWRKFREIFSYANDIFLLSVGQVLIAMSQTPLITTLLGLEANAVWSTMTKTFTMAQQLLNRVFDFSATPFAEMMVRSERDRLRHRFRDIVTLTGSFGVVVCLGVALLNASFVQIWMRGKFSWPFQNDLLMAAFVLIGTCTRCHIGLAGLTKNIGLMKYASLIEGAVFVVLGWVISPTLGLAGILIAGIVANVLCSGSYGFYRTMDYFSVGISGLLFGWLKQPWLLLLSLLPVVVGTWFLTEPLPALMELGVNAAAFGALSLACLLMFGLPGNLRAELLARFRRKQALPA